MTEEQWLAATDPGPMLEALRGKASERKVRLLAVACCRHLWDLLAEEASRNAVEVAERYADGRATGEELGTAAAAAWAFAGREAFPARAAASCTIREDPDAFDFSCVPLFMTKEVFAAAADARASLVATPGEGIVAREAERAAQTTLLRDLFGPLPFHPVALDPSWLTPDVLALGQAAYDNRTLPAGTLEPERLGLLADALEDAGCDNADLLMHLRGEGPHVRGCWAVDLVLGRE